MFIKRFPSRSLILKEGETLVREQTEIDTLPEDENYRPPPPDRQSFITSEPEQGTFEIRPEKNQSARRKRGLSYIQGVDPNCFDRTPIKNILKPNANGGKRGGDGGSAPIFVWYTIHCIFCKQI